MTSVIDSPQPDDLVIEHTVVETSLSLRRRFISGVTIIVFGLITILGWGVGAKPGDAAFAFSEIDSKVTIPDLQVPAEAAAIVLGVIMVLIGVWQLLRGFSRRQMKWVLPIVIVLFVLAFLCWAATGSVGSAIDLVGVLQQTIFLSVPLVLGAMAGIMCERTGVINVAIEGQMLAGAFMGALVGSAVSNLGVGVFAAIAAGGVMGALLAVFAIKFMVNQVVLGVVLNGLALGLTGYGYDALMRNSPGNNSSNHLSPHAIPGLSDIPIIGQPLFNQNYIVYATYLIVIGIDIALFRTRWGLRTRSVGEHPKAADTVGIKVLGLRYWNVIIGGMIAGLAGAFLTVGSSGEFIKNPVGMTSGKGFIALAAVIFGKWSPRGALGAALLFGFTTELQVLLSIIGTPVTIPSGFLLMLPYVVTILAVAGLVGSVRAPGADGEPYVKG
jgi:general nucleoside transport system permease protein